MRLSLNKVLQITLFLMLIIFVFSLLIKLHETQTNRYEEKTLVQKYLRLFKVQLRGKKEFDPKQVPPIADLSKEILKDIRSKLKTESGVTKVFHEEGKESLSSSHKSLEFEVQHQKHVVSKVKNSYEKHENGSQNSDVVDELEKAFEGEDFDQFDELKNGARSGIGISENINDTETHREKHEDSSENAEVTRRNISRHVLSFEPPKSGQKDSSKMDKSRANKVKRVKSSKSEAVRYGHSEGKPNQRCICRSAPKRRRFNKPPTKLSDKIKKLYPHSKIGIDSNNHEVIKGGWQPLKGYQKNKFNHVVDFVIENEDVCVKKKEILLFIFVKSAPSYIGRRTKWRKFWGRKEFLGDNIIITFAIARARTQKENDEIALENMVYKDIIQLNYIDEYYSLTTKMITMLHWTLKNCQKAEYVFETDDDSIVLIEHFRRYLTVVKTNQKVYAGVADITWPQRGISKWNISYDQYPFEFYPRYVLGLGTLFSKEALQPILNASRLLPLFPFDDVFIGFCAKLAGIPALNIPGFHTYTLSAMKYGGLSRTVALNAKLVNGVRERDKERVFYQLMQYSWGLVEKRQKEEASKGR